MLCFNLLKLKDHLFMQKTIKKQLANKRLTKKRYPLAKDVETIDGIMKASYEVVSGDAGKKRQWQRDISVHSPNAVYAFSVQEEGKDKEVIMNIEDFQKETDFMVMKTGFFENEIYREVRVFGNMAHVWSTYETRLQNNGPVVRTGINSVQLYKQDNRWWIFSWIFDKEKGDTKIPQTFKPQ